MAKFAKVTYGTKGESKPYTYVVNDNVRSGDFLQPTFKHIITGKLCTTTGIVQSLNKQAEIPHGVQLREAIKGSDFQIRGDKDENGLFKEGGLGKTVKGVDGVFRGQKDFVPTKQINLARAANLAIQKDLVAGKDGNVSTGTATKQAVEAGGKYLKKFETYDEYAKQFTGGK